MPAPSGRAKLSFNAAREGTLATTSSGQDRDSLVGLTLGGRYEILEVLASGGAGHVLRAIQQPLGREVAVKVLRNDIVYEARKEFESRFLREAALAGRLSHPNVVTVHDFGVSDDGTRFVVMELLEGRTLKDALALGALEPREAARIGEGIVAGLRHAHKQGLVHRDIKPSNIFLVRDDDGAERPMIVDFGLVRGTFGDAGAEVSEVTSTGTFMGTPAYMAPEQARGSEVDPKADVYSFGCLLYRMLAGVLPFRAESPLAIALAHLKDDYPPIRDRAGIRVDPALEGLVRRCMEKAPADRPDSGELLERLRSWRIAHADDADGTLSRPPTSIARPARGARGAGLLALAGATGVFVVGLACMGLVGGGVALWTSPHAPHEGPSLGEIVRPQRVEVVRPKPVPELREHVVAPRRASQVVSEPTREVETPIEVDVVPVVPVVAAVAPVSAAPVGRAAPAMVIDLGEPLPERVSEPVQGSIIEPAPPGEGPARVPAADSVSPILSVGEPLPSVGDPSPSVGDPIPSIGDPIPSVGEPSAGPAIVVDGVRFGADHAERALALLNDGTEEQLRATGAYSRGVTIILENRPFPSLAAFAATPYIGEKTVLAVARATE